MAATAQNINFATAASLQSPIVAIKLAEQTAQESDHIVDIGTGKPKSGKKMLTNSSPRLNQAPPTSKANTTSALQGSETAASLFSKGLTFLTLLEEYMNSMNALQIALSSNQTNINQAQFTIQQSFITSDQAQVTKAVKAYNAYEQALYEQQHQSLWSRICSYFVIGLSMLLAGLTGGATALIGAALITTLMMTGAMNKLDQAVLGSNAPSWETGLFNLGVAIVGTALTCAVTGALSAALSSAADSGADTAASSASESAAEDASEDSGALAAVLPDVGSSVDTAASTAESTAEGALNAIDKEVSADVAAEEGSAASQNAISNSKGFLAKAYDAGFSTTSVLMNGTQMFASLNPVGDLITAFLQTSFMKELGVSAKIAQIVGQVVGMVITIVASILAGRACYKAGAAGDAEDPLLKLMANKLGAGKLALIQIGVGLVNMAFAGTSGGFQIAAGETQKKESHILRKIGNANSALILFQGLLEIIGQQIQAQGKSFSNLINTYAQMNSNYDAYVTPGAVAAQVL